jgi:hypothetical protein
MGKPFIDLTNQTFNYWTVIGPHKAVPRPSGKGSARTHWFCTCQCGNTAWIDATNLRQGISQSCGCKPQRIVAGKGSPAAIAASKANTKHGYSGNKNPLRRLYTIWSHLKLRCDNSRATGFIHYGGRGITYDPTWKDFEPFRQWALANGYTDSLTLERNNVNGNYEPSNCCFKTRRQQLDNTRRTIWLTPTLTLSAFSQAHNLSYDLVWHTYKLRIKHAQAFEKLMQILDNQDYVGV